MELRRVQRTSGGTFFVCIPKDWAERNGLDRSSLVSLSETADGRLIVDAKYTEEKKLQVVTIKPDAPVLEREITGKYLLGYDIIRVEAKDRISPEAREIVKQVSSRLIGLEIIEEDYSKVVLQCLLESSAFPPDKILQREESIVSGMHRDAVTALMEGDVHLAKNVVARDNEANRLYFLLVRILRTVIQNSGLSEKLGISSLDCLDYRVTASLVESIGDQSVQIAELAVKLASARIPGNLSQLLLRLHRTTYEAHENAFRAMDSHDISLADSVRNNRQSITHLFGEVESALQKEPLGLAPAVLAAASAIVRIYDHSQDIADLIMPKRS